MSDKKFIDFFSNIFLNQCILSNVYSLVVFRSILNLNMKKNNCLTKLEKKENLKIKMNSSWQP